MEIIKIMIVYLAGFKSIENQWKKPTEDIYILSSFFEHRNGVFGDYVYQEKHILDSGAFSILRGKKSNIDFIDYSKKYSNFINKTNQQLFFELDLYQIIGLEKTEQLRDMIEQTNMITFESG